MGYLQEGQWIKQPVGAAADDGQFKRQDSVFRHWITADGSAGPTGDAGFKAEAGRYHLYVSLACPWAHRTLIVRHLKGLDALIPVSVVHWHLDDDGWSFAPGAGVTDDPVCGARLLRELYVRSNPTCSGKVTVPVLWDKATDQIVSNESADIIRMFDSAFNAVGATGPSLYPVLWRSQIDAINTRVYDTLNNGVYRAGFATTQQAYEDAVRPLFDTLDWLETHLYGQAFLCGEQPTEADWRLFTTLVRFDAVYVGHFKCNLKRLVDYPVLWDYTRRLFQWPGVRDTVNFHHIKHHYYGSHPSINPSGIVPIGPLLDFEAPIQRR